MSRVIDELVAFGPWNVRILMIIAVAFGAVILTRFPRLLVFAAMGSYAVIMFNPNFATVPGIIDMRLVGLALAVYLAMLRQRLPRFRVLRGGAFPATAVYLVIGLVFMPVAADTGAAVKGLSGTLTTLIFAWVLLNATDEDEIRSAIRWIAGLMVIGSIIYVQVSPSAAMVAGRWRGLTANANTLGLFAGLYFLAGKRLTGRWSLGAVVAVLLGSASRASTFALGIVVGPKILEGRSRRVQRASTVAALIVAIPILHAVFFSSADASGTATQTKPGITRTQNTRIDEWREGIDIVNAHPLTGVGVGSQPRLVSSSIISPLVEEGFLALVPLAMIGALAVTKIRSESTMARSMFVLLIVNGVFEMWLFAGGSFFFMVFLLVAYDPKRVSARADAAAGDDPKEPAIASGRLTAGPQGSDRLGMSGVGQLDDMAGRLGTERFDRPAQA